MSRIKEKLEEADLTYCDFCGEIDYYDSMTAIPKDCDGDYYEFEYMCRECQENYAREVQNGNDK